MVPLRITGPRAPTPQPLPSGSLVNPSPIGKRGRQDKGKEKELAESEEEGGGGRRRSGRLEKSNAKRKLREGASQEEESGSEDSSRPKWRIKEKAVNFWEGGMEGMEEEVSDSTRSDSGDGKESKEVIHVMMIIDLGCVDLTRD